MLPVLLSVPRLVQGVIAVLAGSSLSSQNQPFSRDAEYFQVSKDFVFTEEKIMTLQVKNLIKCATLCSMTDECNAINYQRRVAHVDQMNICEVLRLRGDPGDATLVTSTGWSAYRLELNTTIQEPLTNRANESEVTTKKDAITFSTVNSKSTTTTAKEPEVTSNKDAITLSAVNSKTTTTKAKESEVTTKKDAITFSTVNNEITTAGGFVDNNPEYCSIDGAFTYSSQIYLVSGDAVYVYDDVTQLSIGPIKTHALSNVVPGISTPIDGIFVDETETTLNVIKGEILTTYSTPSSTFSWTQTQQTTVSLFFDRSLGTVTGIYEFNGDTIILLGKKATALSTTKSTPMNSNSPHNILKATNKNSAPGSTSAASALTSQYVLIVDSNQAYSFIKPTGADKGTWGTLGAVRCRMI